MPSDFDGLVIFIAGFLAWLLCAGVFLGVKKKSGQDLDDAIKVPITTVVLAVVAGVAYYVLYLTEAKPFNTGAYMLLLGAITAVQQGIFQYTKNVAGLTTLGQNQATKDNAVLDAVASDSPDVASKAQAILTPRGPDGPPR